MTKDILNEFKNIDGLKEVIERIKDINNSEIHEMFYKASKNKDRWGLELDSKADELLQVKYANKILKTPIIYKPPKTDVIIRRNFYSAFLLINWIYWIHNPKTNDTGYDEQIKILESLMISLDDFDKIESFKEPNEEFYKKLKNTTWDNNGKNLCEELNNTHGHIVFEKLGIRKGRSIYLTEEYTITFFAACNAVNQGRDKILPEDIVKAYKTYFKLLNTDISILDAYDKINQEPVKLNHKPELIENQQMDLDTTNSNLEAYNGIEKEIKPKGRKGRKFIGIIAGVITFVGIGSLIIIGVQNIWPDYSFSEHPFERISLLFICFSMASWVYNLIKGNEPEIKEKKGITSKEISKRLEEMRNPDKHITIDKPDTENPEFKAETVESNKSENLEEDKSKIKENNLKKTDLNAFNPTVKTYSSEIEKNVHSNPVKIKPKAAEINDIKNESLKSISTPIKNNIETLSDRYKNIELNQKSCPTCGSSIEAQGNYCAYCGSKLDLEHASVLGRFFALLIDWVILAIASFSLLIIIGIIFDGNDDLILSIWLILTIFIGFLYFVVLEGPLMQGQTIGKIAVSIRVVDQKSMEPISYSQSFIRNFLLLIDLMPYVLPYLLGFISILASKKNQRIGDMGAKAIVIKDSKKESTMINHQEKYQHGNE